MSSITAQQTKLYLELVPKENRIDIDKCNGRIPRGLTPREPTFQVVLDAIALIPWMSLKCTCTSSGIPCTSMTPSTDSRLIRRNDSSLLWKSSDISFRFAQECVNPGELLLLLSTRVSRKTSGLDKLRLSRAQILWESSQIYGAVLPECLTSPEMKESKAYKTYLGHATGVVPPKIAIKFKKASPSKKDSIVFRETPVKTKSTGKEKVDVSRGKVTEKPPSVEKITPTVTSKGTGDKLGVPDVTEDDLSHPQNIRLMTTKSESKSWGNDEDDNNNEQESSNEVSKQENESEEQESDSEQDEEFDDDNQEEEEVDQENEFEDDEIKSDEDKGMDDTIDQFDDVDARLEEPTQTSKEIVQGEGADVEMDEAQQGNENLETTQEQVVDDAHVTVTTVTKKTEVPVTSSSRSSNLASEFLNFSEPTTGLKKKDSTSGSSKSTKSQPKYSGKSILSEEPVFEVADSDMPQDHEGNLGDNEDKPRNETASRRDWFKKPTPP
ncbi:hypothetical protein Tco_0529251 [Tanacetum coccineum]